MLDIISDDDSIVHTITPSAPVTVSNKQTVPLPIINISSSDADESNLATPSCKHCQASSLSPPPSAQHAQLRSPSASPTKVTVLSPGHTISKQQKSPSPSDLFDDDDIRRLAWPGDYPCNMIAKGFEQCELACCTQKPIAKAFELVFGVPYVSSTYYSTLKHWKESPQALHNEAIANGLKEEGTWSHFLKCQKEVTEN
jgi:hypothetical protein